MNINKDTIIHEIRLGNEEAFRYLFDEHYLRLFYFAKEFVNEEESAREILQETFLALWEKRTSLEENTNIKAYLFSIVKNKSLNFLKHKKVQLKYAEYSFQRQRELEINYNTLSGKAIDRIIEKELQQEIQKIIDEFPPRTKQIFLLSRHENLQYLQIAKHLEISVKTVEAHISKALKLIRTMLKKQFPEFNQV